MMGKYAVCNELFGSAPLGKACRIIREAGFDGVEFAPFTIFGDFSSDRLREGIHQAREILAGEGLAFAGFHWLMTKPEGLHLATADKVLRRKSRDHLARLLDAAGELGGGALILGSPRQRKSLPGQGRRETTALLARTLSELAPAAAQNQSRLLIEQLSPDQTDVINTMEEAAELVDVIAEASIRSMFDFHNAISETEPWDVLIERYYPYIEHVHINEVDGRAPGTGNSDYRAAYAALRARGYDKWISVEIFEVPDNPEKTLRDAMALFRVLEHGGMQ